MNEFLLIFRGGDARRTEQSPEEMQAHMAKWGQWMGGLGEQGKLIGGQPLAQEGTVLSGESGQTVTDGPFAEGNEIVGGYLMVKAEDQSAANKIATGCPIFEHGGTVEVRKINPM